MQTIFVTATNTDIGKTYATKLLLQQYASFGYRVGVLKPIETGVTTLPQDGSELLALAQQLNPLLRHLHVNDIVPIQFSLPAAPFVANQGRNINLTPIHDALQQLKPLCDIVIIEGAGGLLVPIDDTTMILDLITYCNATALLVSHCRLGCINDTLVNMRLLDAHALTYSVALNCKEGELEHFKQVSQPYFDAHCQPYYLLNTDVKALAESLLKF